jgi:hypothetical protein
MTSRDFVYFLQGFFEINEPQTINKQQVEIIKNHLNLVFKHEIDPSLNEGKSKEEVKELQDVHDGKKEVKKDPNIVKKLEDIFNKTKPKSWLHDNWRPDGNYDNALLRC